MTTSNTLEAPTADAGELDKAGIHSIQLISPDACAAYLERMRSDKNWAAARVHHARDYERPGLLRPRMRKAETNGLFEFPDLIADMDERVESMILPPVNARYRSNYDTLGEHQAVRYEPGGHYLTHMDSGKNLEYRHFTVLCYLNDDMEGGETTFPDFDIAVKPKTGMAITFPSEYRHGALPVLSGHKSIYLCWIVDAPPIQWF